MIRPRNLVLPPLLSIGFLLLICVGVAMLWTCPEPPEEPLVGPVEVPQSLLAVEDVPERYEGTFRWDGDQAADEQHVVLTVEDVNEVEGLLVATGRGTYTIRQHRAIEFSFRIEIDPVSGEFVMWESAPDVSAGFVTDGRHKAYVFDGLDVVEARWHGDDGAMGSLSLRATEERVAPEVAPRLTERPPADAMTLPGGVRLDLRHRGPRQKCMAGGDDRARVYYEGWNAGGVFDSAWERGRPATFSPSQVIPGFASALLVLCEGDFARVWIPAEQAYGSDPGAGRIAGDLVFDVEVEAILPRRTL